MTAIADETAGAAGTRRARSLEAGAAEIVACPDTGEKVRLSYQLARDWFARAVSLRATGHFALPERPRRPARTAQAFVNLTRL